jgi:hypothetical protein
MNADERGWKMKKLSAEGERQKVAVYPVSILRDN